MAETREMVERVVTITETFLAVLADEMAADGPIEWIQLLDGHWGCQRPGATVIEEHEADAYRREWW